MGLQVTVKPTEEPVSLPEAKLHLRQDQPDDDDLIKGLIQAAREYVEVRTGRALCTQTLALTMDSFYDQRWTQYGSFSDLRYGKYNSLNNWNIRLPKPPLVSVGSVVYVDANGATQTLDPTNYIVDSTAEPGRLTPAYGIPWPITRSIVAAVTITYIAGYGHPSAVPASIKSAMKLMIGAWYENREAISAGPMSAVPMAADALLAAYWSGEYR